MQQSRSDLTRVIQIVKRCISRKVEGERREQRQTGGNPKLPVYVTPFVGSHNFSCPVFEWMSPRSFSQAALVLGGTFWSASTNQETVESEFTTVERTTSPAMT